MLSLIRENFFFSLFIILLLVYTLRQFKVSFFSNNFPIFLAFFDKFNDNIFHFFAKENYYSLFPHHADLISLTSGFRVSAYSFFSSLYYGWGNSFVMDHPVFTFGGIFRLFYIFVILSFFSNIVFYFIRYNKNGFYYRWFYAREVTDPREMFFESNLDGLVYLQNLREESRASLEKATGKDDRFQIEKDLEKLTERFIDMYDDTVQDWPFLAEDVADYEEISYEYEFDAICCVWLFGIGQIWMLYTYKQILLPRVPTTAYAEIWVEKVRIVTSGDYFVFHHAFSNIVETTSMLWKEHIMTSYSDYESGDYSKHNFYKIYWDNLLIDLDWKQMVDNFFLDSHETVYPDNVITFQQWIETFPAKKLDPQWYFYDAENRALSLIYQKGERNSKNIWIQLNTLLKNDPFLNKKKEEEMIQFRTWQTISTDYNTIVDSSLKDELINDYTAIVLSEPETALTRDFLKTFLQSNPKLWQKLPINYPSSVDPLLKKKLINDYTAIVLSEPETALTRDFLKTFLQSKLKLFPKNCSMVLRRQLLLEFLAEFPIKILEESKTPVSKALLLDFLLSLSKDSPLFTFPLLNTDFSVQSNVIPPYAVSQEPVNMIPSHNRIACDLIAAIPGQFTVPFFLRPYLNPPDVFPSRFLDDVFFIKEKTYEDFLIEAVQTEIATSEQQEDLIKAKQQKLPMYKRLTRLEVPRKAFSKAIRAIDLDRLEDSKTVWVDKKDGNIDKYKSKYLVNVEAKRKFLKRHFVKHARYHLGDYLMNAHAYRLKKTPFHPLHGRRFWTSNIAHVYAKYPKLYPFGCAYSFFNPSLPTFITSLFENIALKHFENYDYRFDELDDRRRALYLQYFKQSYRPSNGRLFSKWLVKHPNFLNQSSAIIPTMSPSDILLSKGYKASLKEYVLDSCVGKLRNTIWEYLTEDQWAMLFVEVGLELEQEEPAPDIYMEGPILVNYLWSDAAENYLLNYFRSSFQDPLNLTLRESGFEEEQYHVSGTERLRSRAKLPLKNVIKKYRTILRHFVFNQAYVDILQAKYGQIVGLFMFSSPGNTLNLLEQTLFDFTLDYSWYEKTHFVTFKDLTFTHEDVISLQQDLYGFSKDSYGLFDLDYDNPFSNLPAFEVVNDYDSFNMDLELHEMERAIPLEYTLAPALGEDLTFLWLKHRFLGNYTWPLEYFSMQNKDILEKSSKTLQLYQPYSFKNSLLLNLLFEPKRLLLAQRNLYSSWLEQKPIAKISFELFSNFKYFKNFLREKDFSFLSYNWLSDIIVKCQENDSITLLTQAPYLYNEPLENFDGHYNFSFLNKYYYTFFIYLFDVFSFYLKTYKGLPEDYFVTRPPFEDFCQTPSLFWFRSIPVTKRIGFSIFLDSELSIPPAFEDFTQVFDITATSSYWRAYLYESFYSYFNSVVQKATQFSLKAFKKEISTSNFFSTQKNRPYAIEGEAWYFSFFENCFSSYAELEESVDYYFEHRWVRKKDYDPYYIGGKPYSWSVWTFFFEQDHELESMMMPFFRYLMPHISWTQNAFYPHDAGEFARVTFGETYLLSYFPTMINIDDTVYATRDLFLEADFIPEGDILPAINSMDSYSVDSEEDGSYDNVDSEDYDSFYDFDLGGFAELVTIEEFYNYSIRWSDVDYITRLVLYLSDISSDENGTFHIEMREPQEKYGLEYMDGTSFDFAKESNPGDIFWNAEDFEDSIFNSYAIPFGEDSFFNTDLGFIPFTQGSYRFNIPIDNISRFDSRTRAWFADWDFWELWEEIESRGSNIFLQVSIDGDLDSFDPECCWEDSAFCDDSVFSYFEIMEDEDDMDPFEMAWEEEDDAFINDPYFDLWNGPVMDIVPGPAREFIASAFPVPAWHGFPIPIDSDGWVEISWFWRYAKNDELTYSWDYLAETYSYYRQFRSRSRNFYGFFADTLGIFNQIFTGYQKSYNYYVDDNKLANKYLYKYSHNMRISDGLGLDLTSLMCEQFMPDDTYTDGDDFNDSFLMDDSWDDEEDEVDVAEEGGDEFFVEDYDHSVDNFELGFDLAGDGNFNLYEHVNPSENSIDIAQFEEGEFDDIETFLLHHYTSKLPFDKSFDWYSRFHDSKNLVPWEIKTDKYPLTRFNYMEIKWNDYGFVDFVTKLTAPFTWLQKYNIPLDTHYIDTYKNNPTTFFARFAKKYAWIWRDMNWYVFKRHNHAAKYIRNVPAYHRVPIGLADENTVNIHDLSKRQFNIFFSRNLIPIYFKDERKSFDTFKYSFLKSSLFPLTIDRNNMYYRDYSDFLHSYRDISSIGSLTRKKVPLTYVDVCFEFLKTKKYHNQTVSDMLHNWFVWAFKDPISNMYEEFSEKFSGRNIPAKYLNYEEEDALVKRLYTDYSTTWDERNRHRVINHGRRFYNQARVAETILLNGYLHCFARYNFDMDRLTMFYNDFLCLERTSTESFAFIKNTKKVWYQGELASLFYYREWYSTNVRYWVLKLFYWLIYFFNTDYSSTWLSLHFLYQLSTTCFFYKFFWLFLTFDYYGIKL